jgi:hypothetical protein
MEILISILVSILAGTLIMEFYAWHDTFAKWLLERAVRRISEEDQDRCREEWKADLEAMPSTIVKVVYALTNFRTSAADQINEDLLEAKWDEVSLQFEEILIRHGIITNQIRAIRMKHERHCTLGAPENPDNKLSEMKTYIDPFGEKFAQAESLIASLAPKLRLFEAMLVSRKLSSDSLTLVKGIDIDMKEINDILESMAPIKSRQN